MDKYVSVILVVPPHPFNLWVLCAMISRNHHPSYNVLLPVRIKVYLLFEVSGVAPYNMA